jgi:hypothetical protein
VCADASQGSGRPEPPTLLSLPDVHKITGFSVRAMKRAIHEGAFPAITFQGRWYTPRLFVELILEIARSGRITSVEEIGRAWIEGVALQVAAA